MKAFNFKSSVVRSLFIILLGLSSLFTFEKCFAYSLPGTEQLNVSDEEVDTLQNANEDSGISQSEQEYNKAINNAEKAATKGPAVINLLNQARLKISDKDMFVPKKEAAEYMQLIGNTVDSDFVGLILPKDNKLPWFISVRYIDSGYLPDGDAENWTANSLLESIRKDTDDANKERISNGYPALKILGWVEEPKYNKSTHKLIWSMSAEEDGAEAGSDATVNYNTYILGREGYFKLNLVTSKTSIAKDKVTAQKILTGFTFNDGKRYEDFNKSTDRIAEYGLAALITGVAAKKLGLIALAGVFLVKAGKFLLILPLLMWRRIKNLFATKDNDTDTPR